MMLRPSARTAAAIMTATGALFTKDAKKKVTEQMSPRTSNTHGNNLVDQSTGHNELERKGETIGLACIFEQWTITNRRSGNDENNNVMEPEEAPNGQRGQIRQYENCVGTTTMVRDVERDEILRRIRSVLRVQ
jgi:hypothetical protein